MSQTRATRVQNLEHLAVCAKVLKNSMYDTGMTLPTNFHEELSELFEAVTQLERGPKKQGRPKK